MGQRTLPPFNASDEARLVDQILNVKASDRSRVARAMLESGAAFKQEHIQNAQEFRMDREFIAIDFTDVVVSSSAYVSGSAAKRAICIASDHKDAITKEHAGDLIVITHLVLPYDTSNANIVAGLRISANDLAFSLEVPSIQRP
ncbi:MAG: hypothetical protein KDB07_08980, partial [Planctomycetes bacterium]|nr:hypothetical protein [Planctomycetota bacterium]